VRERERERNAVPSNRSTSLSKSISGRNCAPNAFVCECVFVGERGGAGLVIFGWKYLMPNANFANGKSKLRRTVAQSERNGEGMVF